MSDKPIIEIHGEFEIITEDAEIVADSDSALAQFLQRRRHMFERHEHCFAKKRPGQAGRNYGKGKLNDQRRRNFRSHHVGELSAAI